MFVGKLEVVLHMISYICSKKVSDSEVAVVKSLLRSVWYIGGTNFFIFGINSNTFIKMWWKLIISKSGTIHGTDVCVAWNVW